MPFTIERCYDSHCHFLATGQIKKGLTLFDLAEPSDVSKLKIEPQHFQGEWLVGFGWDQHKWTGPSHGKFPTKEMLDIYFPDFPVAFSRADGHASWLNSRAIEKIGPVAQIKNEFVMTDASGNPTGIFLDTVKIQIDQLIPPQSKAQKKNFLKAAADYFLKRGFTHIRDMSCTLEQWQILKEMDEAEELSLYVEENFTCENLVDFERAIKEAKAARALPSKHLRAQGIKFYFDGALGSQGALLSQPYQGSHQCGFSLWKKDDLMTAIRKTWQEGFEVCIHTIGDEAAHQIAQLALQLKNDGISGRLNFEHAEMLRPETVEIMTELDCVCHMQPCHWLSDRHWLKEKLGPLYKHAFPWRSLEVAGIKFQFGSDAPIEEASVWNNLLALEESASEGIAPLSGDPLSHFGHPDVRWGAECKSKFEKA